MEHNKPPRKTLINSGNSIYWKAAFVVFLMIILMIPNGMLQSLIYERQSTKHTVQNEIASSWGNRQTISGPILAIPYSKVHEALKEENNWTTEHTYYLAPDSVDITSDVDSEIRKKSIYEEVLYTSSINVAGAFDLDDIPNKDLEKIDWSNATLILGVYDPSGINANVNINWEGSTSSMSPGSPHQEAVGNGIHTKLDLSENHKGKSSFQTQLDLRGHYHLYFDPTAFLAFFFFEIMYRKRVHPIQYTFIGLSLSIFYYLLLSMSEHFGFDLAYLIASIAIISLIIGYSKSILQNTKSLWILALILILLYSYIFVLLQLEEYALIAGAVGLFSILATIMYMSRNVDWYDMTSGNVSNMELNNN